MVERVKGKRAVSGREGVEGIELERRRGSEEEGRETEMR